MTVGAVLLICMVSSSATGELVPHDAIHIDGNSNFTVANGVVSGAGTSGDPYIIEGWTIDSGTKAPIRILNTNKSFIVRNMELNGGATSLKHAVIMNHVENGTVENVTIRTLSGHALRIENVINLSFTYIKGRGTFDFSCSTHIQITDVATGSFNFMSCEFGKLERCVQYYGSKIWLSRCKYFEIIDCVSSNNNGGLDLYGGTSHTLVEGCTFINNSDFDLHITGSWITLRNNTLGVKGISIYNTGDHDIDTSNTVDGRPYLYFQYESDRVIDGNAGQVYLYECRNFTVRNLTISGPTICVAAVGSWHCTFENLTMESPDTCLRIIWCTNTRISRCLAVSPDETNRMSSSVYLYDVIDVRIDSCTIRTVNDGCLDIVGASDPLSDITVINSSFSGTPDTLYRGAVTVFSGSLYEITFDQCTFNDSSYGLWIRNDVRKLTIVNCTIAGNEVGIRFEKAANCQVYYNTFYNCSYMAFEILDVSSGIQIFHNNMIKNHYRWSSQEYRGVQATSEVNAVLSKDRRGNYWEDYPLWYPYANRSGVTWDVPYQLGGPFGLEDRYPLAIPVDLIPPIADAGANKTLDQNSTVTLDGRWSTDNMGVDLYEWTFAYQGSPVTLTGERPTFEFDHPGEYYISLVVWDGWGNSDTDSVMITILDTEPPHFVGKDRVDVTMGEPFDMNATACWDNVGIVAFNWTLVLDGMNRTYDGITLADLVIEEPGDYVMVLTMTDAVGNSMNGSILIHVRDIIPPTADAGPHLSVPQGDLVKFNGSASTDNYGIARWNWTFEYDGEWVDLVGVVSAFLFEIPGTYRVILTVTDEEGLQDIAFKNVHIVDTEPPVAMLGSDIVIDQHEQVEFDGSRSSDNVQIVGWTIEFEYGGQVESLDGPVAYFTFDIAGEYEVVLNVTDTDGNWAINIIHVTVMDITPPTPLADYDPVVEIGDMLILDAGNSTDNVGISRFDWTIEHHGTLSSHQGPMVEIVPEELGEYTVTLSVYDARENGNSILLVVDVVDTVPPVVDGGEDLNLTIPQVATLDGRASSDKGGILNWTWTFEYNGSTVVLYGPVAEFAFRYPGDYQVKLTVLDIGGLSDEDSIRVTVWDEPDTTEDDDDESGFPWVWAVVTLVVVAVVLVSFMLWRRSRG